LTTDKLRDVKLNLVDNVEVLGVLELIAGLAIHLQEFLAAGFHRRSLGQAPEI
jgi:hypothetical protein